MAWRFHPYILLSSLFFAGFYAISSQAIRLNTRGIHPDQSLKSNKCSEYDAIIESLEKLSQAKHRRRALVVITDGRDQHSQHSLDDLIRRAQQSDAQIYTIGFFSPIEADVYKAESGKVKLADGQEVDNPRFVFKTLAAETGAETFFPKSTTELDAAISQIAASLRRQYTISYYPTDPDNSDRYRRISVRLIGDRSYQGIVQTRQGYRLTETLSRANPVKTAPVKSDGAQNIISVTISPKPKIEDDEKFAPAFIQEKFDAPSSSWPQNDRSLIKKGKYYVTGQSIIPAAPFVYRDFEASIVAETVGSPKDGASGILTASGFSFRINESGYYTLLVAPLPNGKEGLYKLLKVSAGNQTDLINWRKDPVITFRNRIEDRSFNQLAADSFGQ